MLYYAVPVVVGSESFIIDQESSFSHIHNENITFVANFAEDGGAIAFSELSATIPGFNNITITANSATRFGGGIYFDGYYHDVRGLRNFPSSLICF